MKIDGVEYPDHVVEAFCKACELDMPITFLTDEEEAVWFKEVMKGFLENFYMGWKAQMRQETTIVKRQGMAEVLHEELSSWLKRMQESGEHPTIHELGTMVTRAGVVKRVIKEIRNQISYELV